MAEEALVGKVIHFFNNIGVAVIKLSGVLKVGDKIAVRGASTDVTQTVDSMQIEHVSIKEAKAGQDIGLKLKDRARAGDAVYKITA